MPDLDVKDPAERLELAYLYANGCREEIVNLASVACTIGARCAMVHIDDIVLLRNTLTAFQGIPHRVRAEVVIDFPDGAGGIVTKLSQAEFACQFGAVGADIVVNLRFVKEHDQHSIAKELRAVLALLPDSKAIIQLPYLWQYQRNDIGWLLQLLAENKIFCVKDWTTRSDNFLKPVAVDDDTRLRYLEYVADYIAKHNLDLLKKIAGKVTADNAKRFIDAGADLLGISYGKAYEIRNALLKIV